MDKRVSENDRVKSTAVVKYSFPKLGQFTKLKCNTDLKLPPANWLSSSGESYGINHVLYQPKSFSSFKMAQTFIDCIGSVDVVSDADNIKNLLKIPYQKGLISMMVHRINNTLLLDEFDIYKHILRQAKSEWEWFSKFYHENINEDVAEYERHLYVKNKKRKAIQQKSLISKFLYHSLVPDESDSDINSQYDSNISLPLTGPLLPNPSPSTEVPEPSSFDETYNRNVIWSFEDIEMLLGTDMPIFGGGTHPCISLRLNDMNKPISVLTGIDYWLDNLMSNVPEVVMCYHLNGIVQKYELIKTEDLPRLDDSKFSPKLIRDVAQSILSFLKSNTTKAGHTYWLFKGKDEDVVKLYDLTSLCNDYTVENSQNPFTIPVAMLLYRVARNLKYSVDRKQPGTIRVLLKNCIKLLSEEKYPEIVTSSHFMLSDLYIPGETNPDNPVFDSFESEDFDLVDDEDDVDDVLSGTKVLYLGQRNQYIEKDVYNKQAPPIVGTLSERCYQALEHIVEGLKCLKYFLDTIRPQSQTEEYVKMANKFEPIPMSFGKIDETTNTKNNKIPKKSKEQTVKKNNAEVTNLQVRSANDNKNAIITKEKTDHQPLPTWQDQEPPNISWKHHLRFLLLEKTVLVYAILAEHHYGQKNYGNSLKYLGILVRCIQVIRKMSPNSNLTLEENCLLGRAGDCCIMMVQNWDKCDIYNNEYTNSVAEDLQILEQLTEYEQLYAIKEDSMKCVVLDSFDTIEEVLLKAVECYEVALSFKRNDSILRRLGNSYNEIGSFYLHRGKNCNDKLVANWWEKAVSFLKKGINVFKEIGDEANMALLYTNLGHLHRLMAHINIPEIRGVLTNNERYHYNKAYFNYKKALQILGEKSHNPTVWDAVNWELCTSLFSMATILHDHPAEGVSLLDASKEVIEIFQKSLSYCDYNENNPKVHLYKQRAAIIHHNLGAIYHKLIFEQSQTTDSSKKHAILLTKRHYEKSANLYNTLNNSLNYLVVQMQRVALCEALAESISFHHLKIKHYQQCLEIIKELTPVIRSIAQKEIEIQEAVLRSFDVKSKKCDYSSSICSITLLVKQRLQYILKMLIKLYLSKKNDKKFEESANFYKSNYTSTFVLESYDNFYDFVDKFASILESFQNNTE